MIKRISKIILAGLGILFVIFVYKKFTKPNVQDCLKLGSDTRAARCLKEIGETNVTTSTPFTYLNNLEIHNSEIKTNQMGFINLIGTLRNFSPNPAKNVTAKIKLFNKQTSKCSDLADDTQYVKIADYIDKGDSIAVESIVKTKLNTSSGFTYCVEIYSAEEFRN